MHGKLTFTERARFLLSVNFLHSLVQIFLEFLSAHRRLATVSQFYTLRLSDWHLVQEFLQDSKIWWCQVVDSQREEGEGRERGAGNHTFTCLDLVILFLSEEATNHTEAVTALAPAHQPLPCMLCTRVSRDSREIGGAPSKAVILQFVPPREATIPLLPRAQWHPQVLFFSRV
ncbi:hypothetical protein RRG08_033778 [Elysia crispata]|uniref:Uncharacterized protein n=1 Tax=Elysia crispata TaxID=231223 RepID=A0AAE1E4V1_9GAST|nr:hypothetical protein RRG08_033778 [Elysia crispata]